MVNKKILQAFLLAVFSCAATHGAQATQPNSYAPARTAPGPYAQPAPAPYAPVAATPRPYAPTATRPAPAAFTPRTRQPAPTATKTLAASTQAKPKAAGQKSHNLTRMVTKFLLYGVIPTVLGVLAEISFGLKGKKEGYVLLISMIVWFGCLSVQWLVSNIALFIDWLFEPSTPLKSAAALPTRATSPAAFRPTAATTQPAPRAPQPVAVQPTKAAAPTAPQPAATAAQPTPRVPQPIAVQPTRGAAPTAPQPAAMPPQSGPRPTQPAPAQVMQTNRLAASSQPVAMTPPLASTKRPVANAQAKASDLSYIRMFLKFLLHVVLSLIIGAIWVKLDNKDIFGNSADLSENFKYMITVWCALLSCYLLTGVNWFIEWLFIPSKKAVQAPAAKPATAIPHQHPPHYPPQYPHWQQQQMQGQHIPPTAQRMAPHPAAA